MIAAIEWPAIILEAQARRPRQMRAPQQATRSVQAPPRDVPHIKKELNNFIAEARAMRREGQTSPLGGRNRNGAGAPRGNHNAFGTRQFRSYVQMKRRNLHSCLHLLVLVAAVEHLEDKQRRAMAGTHPPQPRSGDVSHINKRQNNFIAEARAMRGAAPATGFKPPITSAPSDRGVAMLRP